MKNKVLAIDLLLCYTCFNILSILVAGTSCGRPSGLMVGGLGGYILALIIVAGVV